jgi:hypothetical protein
VVLWPPATSVAGSPSTKAVCICDRREGQVAVFAESEQPIEVRAEGDASFVFGSAIKHPHPLVLGYYSVHTSEDALARGETEIARIGRRLQADGRL